MSAEFQGDRDAVMLSFKERFATSANFLELFREGMALIEQTAHYLENEGRVEAKALTPPASLVYSTESMKLTTRLMQLASWLLLRRAVANGEITAEMALDHKRRVKLYPLQISHPEGFDHLPEQMKQLIAASYRLHNRLLRLDRSLEEDIATTAPVTCPVKGQIEQLELAFRAA